MFRRYVRHLYRTLSTARVSIAGGVQPMPWAPRRPSLVRNARRRQMEQQSARALGWQLLRLAVAYQRLVIEQPHAINSIIRKSSIRAAASRKRCICSARQLFSFTERRSAGIGTLFWGEGGEQFAQDIAYTAAVTRGNLRASFYSVLRSNGPPRCASPLENGGLLDQFSTRNHMVPSQGAHSHVIAVFGN